MKIVHTYINNMYIDARDETKECFANKWGLVALARLGHDVTLLCGGESGKRKEYHWNGIQVIELPVLLGVNNSSRILQGFVHELLRVDADVFHTHHYCSFIPELTVLVGRYRQIPTYITFHNTLLEGDLSRKGLGLIYLLVMQPFLLMFQRAFFISAYLMNKPSFWILPESRKEVLYNQILPAPRFQTRKKEYSIIFVGRLTHQKGVDTLTRSIKIVQREIPSILLRIIGNGEQKYVAKLKKMATVLGLEKNVLFLGELFGAEKYRLLSCSQVMVVPSRDEGFGNVVIEGQSCGVPLIVSNKGALREAAGGKCLVFDVHSPKDLAAKILQLINDDKLWSQLSTEGKFHADNFTKRDMGKELLSAYTHSRKRSSKGVL